MVCGVSPNIQTVCGVFNTFLVGWIMKNVSFDHSYGIRLVQGYKQPCKLQQFHSFFTSHLFLHFFKKKISFMSVYDVMVTTDRSQNPCNSFAAYVGILRRSTETFDIKSYTEIAVCVFSDYKIRKSLTIQFGFQNLNQGYFGKFDRACENEV